MKKSLLNIAVTMTLSSAVFSGAILSTQAYASEQSADQTLEKTSADVVITADNNSSKQQTTETYLYPGMGVGAASGALIAGPVGLFVGGIIGAIAGANHQVETTVELSDEKTNTLVTENKVDDIAEFSAEATTLERGVQVAQLGSMPVIVDETIESQQVTLLDILTTDLSLDIYFRSGSSNIESFYPARLVAIADLMNNMAKLELHLDGYSDRRGNKTKNINLANARIQNVREQLIDAGVDESRIISKAFGEMKMVSAAGDLEAYTFDRKVVIRFERSGENSIQAMTTALSSFETQDEKAVIADSSTGF